MSDSVYDLKALVSADVSPFNNAMNNSAAAVTSSLSTISQATNQFIGQGFIRTLTKATQSAFAFGQTMADIASISDVNLKVLADNIKSLDNVYGSIKGLGDTIYEIISSGIRGSETELIDFAKVSRETAVTIKADVYDTANVLTTLTNAYGMQANEVGKLADMLFVTVREGKAHGNELARTLGLVTNTAAESGVKLEELSAAISILSRTQSASQSMIGLNQLLNGIIHPTIEARKEAEKWNIEIGATALQTKGLTGILTDMHNKIGGNVEAINKILGNIRAMRAGVALTGTQFDNFIEVLNKAKLEIGSDAYVEAFKTQTATAQQVLENFHAQVEKTYVSIGEDWSGLTTFLIGTTTEFMKAFSDTNAFSKWSVYIAVIYTAVRKLASGIGKLHKAVDNMATGFNGMVGSIPKATSNLKQLRNEMRMVEMSASQVQARMAGVGITPDKVLKHYTSDEYIRAQAEQNIRGKYPSQKVTAFSYALAKATTVLQSFSTSVGNAKTFVNAAFAPDKERVAAKQVWDARRNIKAQAQANIDEMYLPAKHRWRDPKTGRYVAPAHWLLPEDQDADMLRRGFTKVDMVQDPLTKGMRVRATVVAEEEKRLNAELNKQIKACTDAKKAEAEQQKKATQQEKQYQAELEREKQRVASALREEERAIRLEIERQKHAANLVSRSMFEFAQANKQAAAQRVSGSGAVIGHTPDGRAINALTQEDKARSYALRTRRRYNMALQDRVALTERFNSRFKTSYSNLDKVINRRLLPSFSRFGRIINSTATSWNSFNTSFFGTGGKLSKLGNGLMNLNIVIATATAAWQAGVAIAEHFKFAESKFFRWLQSQQWLPGFIYQAGPSIAFDQEQRDAQESLQIQRASMISTLELAKNQRKLSDATYQRYLASIRSAKTDEELANIRAKYVKMLAPQVQAAAKGRTYEEIRRTFDTAQGSIDVPASYKVVLADTSIENAFKTITARLSEGMVLPNDVKKQLTSYMKTGNIDAIRAYLFNVSTAKKILPNMDYRSGDLGKVPYNLIYNRIFSEIQRTLGTARTPEGYRVAQLIKYSPEQIRSAVSAIQQSNTATYIKDAAEVLTPILQANRGTRTLADFMQGNRELGTSVFDKYTSTETAIGAMDEYIRNMEKALAETVKHFTQMQEAAAKHPEDAVIQTKMKALRSELELNIKAIEEQANLNAQARKRLVELRNEFFKPYDDAEAQFEQQQQRASDVREGRVRAGLMTDTQARSQNIEALQALQEHREGIISQLVQLIEEAPEALLPDIYARYEETLHKLQLTTLELEATFAEMRKTVDDTRKSLLSHAQSYMQQRTKDGRLTNDALYHSLNLVSKATGAAMSRAIARGVYTTTPVNYNRMTKASMKAQRAVAASIDAYMMSQQYADAHMGKTVIDIYNYMKSNNTTMVRR